MNMLAYVSHDHKHQDHTHLSSILNTKPLQSTRQTELLTDLRRHCIQRLTPIIQRSSTTTGLSPAPLVPIRPTRPHHRRQRHRRDRRVIIDINRARPTTERILITRALPITLLLTDRARFPRRIIQQVVIAVALLAHLETGVLEAVGGAVRLAPLNGHVVRGERAPAEDSLAVLRIVTAADIFEAWEAEGLPAHLLADEEGRAVGCGDNARFGHGGRAVHV